RLTVDREARRQPHSSIRPRRFRIPLIGKVEPKYPEQRRHQPHSRCATDILRDRPRQEHGEVYLAALQAGRPRRLVGPAAQNEALDRSRLAPVSLECLQHQLNARVKAHEPVRTRADGRLAKPLFTDALEIFARHDPPRTCGEGAVIGWEIWPRLPEDETHAV